MFTVTTAAADRSLLTENEARAAIGGVDATAPEIATLIKRVSASLVRACRVPAAGATPPTLRLESIEATFRLKSRQEALVLARKPVVTVTWVVENDADLEEDVDFEVDRSAGLLYRLSGDTRICWPSGKIVSSFSAGWETVPDDLKEMASKLAAIFWSEGKRVDPNLKRENIPGVIEQEWWVSPKDDPLIPQEILDGLGPYMHHVIG